MTTKELYTKDARIWVEHPDSVWEGATVTSDYRSGVLIVKLDQSGEIKQIKIKDEKQMPPLRNPSLLIGQNDLTSLSYLHEPAVLHNLKVRNLTIMRTILTICFVAMIFYLLHSTEANYRKPPFNGSIFGKRGTVEYDSTGKALSALCEIASETCQAWYQTLEK